MKQRVLATLAATLLTTAALAAQPAPPVPAQPLAAPGAAVPLYQVPVDAQTTREQLQEILRQYPPAVGEVLRRDHSLLSRADYIAPYPQLVAFIQQHPEVVRNPTFFFGNYDYYEPRTPMSPEIEALGVLLGGMAGFLAFGSFIAIAAWLIRAVIQHRRWLRLSKVQSDVHTKLMDRMTTNEELLAYIQSPAGRRFLESAPIQQEADSPAGQVWWRSAVRARLESAQAATRPMTWLHGVTAAITIGIMLAGIGMAWPTIAEGVAWAREVVGPLVSNAEVSGVVSGVLRQSVLIALAAAACLVIAPVLLYLALSND